MLKTCYNDCKQEPLANELVNEFPGKALREAGRKGGFAIERLKDWKIERLKEKNE